MRARLPAAIAVAGLAACGTRGLLTGAPTHARRGAATVSGGPTPSGPATSRGAAPASGATLLTGDLPLDAAPATAPFATSPGVVLSRLPARHREPAAPARATTVDAARALVGRRDPRDPLAFALAVAADLTGAPAPPIADGAGLVAWAEALGAWDADAPTADDTAAPGDLIVFDRAVAGAPASLVAVALATDERGVVELIYLARGVVRRGYADRARPSLRRDRDGRIVNSHLRHDRDQPPTGTHFRAGELVAGRIRLATAADAAGSGDAR